MHEKLKEARISKGYSQGKFSKVIAMEQTTYSRKERGKSSITEDEWDRFANALDVPKEEIKDEKPLTINNENCTFKDSFFNTQYINVPEKVLDVVMKYNQKLEEDNLFQKQEISRLNQEIKLLKDKLNEK
jgi:transcriptional regulator with XRE-family HTH domain